MEEKSKITDEELFTSKEYQAYLTDKTEAAGRRYNRPVRVTVYADEEDETVAYTDFHGIFINACNRITRSFPSRKLRAMSIDGFRSHEQGHILFTDNRIWQTHLKKLGQGKFYPRKPAGLDAAHKMYASQMLDAILDETDPVPRMVVLQTAKALENTMEDGYVDTRSSYEFPGSPARGIALNNTRFAETCPDITEMVHDKYYDHNIILNMLIQYVRVGEVNNLSGYQGELLDAMNRYIPIVDDCLLDDDARNRCNGANQILIDLWPIMKRCFDALRDKHQQALQQNQQQSGQANGVPGGAGEADESGEQSAQTAQQAVEEDLNGQLPASAPNFTIKSSSVPSDGSFEPDAGQIEAVRTEIGKVLAEETARIAAHSTKEIISSGDGAIERNSEYEGSGYNHAAEDIERLLETIAEHKVHTKMEEELTEELQQEALNISYGNAHKGISITVNRMAHVGQYLIDEYNRVAPALIPLSKRLQYRVRPLIENKRQGGKQTGLYSGKHLNPRALYRQDARLFYNTQLPTEPINIRVAWVNDESGSMGGNDRITRSRAASIVVYDFCNALGIPIMIIGHTAWNSHVEIYSYADFHSVDQMDRYRLADMNARYCNRDGAAIRFAAEKLDRETADVKLLFVISDGQPNDDGYSGSAAEADLRGIKQEYTRKGIKFYAAAIGEDKQNIERIYGRDFLDITDLNDLPILLTNIIARNLPV